MTTHIRKFLMAGGMLMAIAAAPVAASAQQKLPAVRVTGTAAADEMALRAESLSTQIDQFKKAAELFEQSADARTASDPRAVTCLRSAATLRYNSGNKRRSLGLMEKAADRAIRLGDVMLAANAYIDAAVIAQELRQGERALQLGERAALLTRSPLLNGDQRNALLSRMNGWSVASQVASR